MAEEQTQQGEVKSHLFRVTTDEDQRLMGLIQIAYRMGFIPEATIQKFIMFAMNSAHTVLKERYQKTKGA